MTNMEPALADDPNSISRNDDRHSHITIGLRYRAHGNTVAPWSRLDALGWNSVGFNFYQDHPIDDITLDLRRGLSRFEGTIVWRAPNTADEVVHAALVNELLFKRAKQVGTDQALHQRLLKLIRVPGMVVQKKSILASLGLQLGEEKMAELIAKRRQERPMFHYGVKVDSDAWRSVVTQACSLSAVVVSLEKWSGALGKA